MEQIPFAIAVLFIILTLVTVFIFFKAAKNNFWVILVCLVVGLLQFILGISGFYQNIDTTPPRFFLLLPPSIVLIILLFLTKRGKRFIDTLDIKKITLLHSIRVPVELILHSIFLYQLIPVEMTYQGYNFDIISGISAPVIYFLIFNKKKYSKQLLMFWNLVCLALLANIIVIATLSAQTPFQKLAFDQPNVALMYFPFVWLPSIVVPLVLLSHLASIRQLVKIKS